MSRVCIGMPVFNGERFIACALESILDQTFDDLRLVILDNASTDRTQEICEGFQQQDPRVEYHRNEKNIGAPANFNKVFALCDSEYFKWAAADDVLARRYLERCIDELDRDREVVLCHTNVEVIDDDGCAINKYSSPLTCLGSVRPAERFCDLVLAKHACFDVFGVVRSDALTRTPRIGKYKSADRNLLAELALIGKIHTIAEPLFFSRDHSDRSVRISDARQIQQWWGQEHSFAFPHWRHLTEYIHSVNRASISWAEKLFCYRAVAKWGLYHWRHLGSDIKTVARQSLGITG